MIDSTSLFEFAQAFATELIRGGSISKSTWTCEACECICSRDGMKNIDTWTVSFEYMLAKNMCRAGLRARISRRMARYSESPVVMKGDAERPPKVKIRTVLEKKRAVKVQAVSFLSSPAVFFSGQSQYKGTV